MDRRSFLVGSGAILTTSFLDRAHWYLEKKASVVPLLKLSVVRVFGTKVGLN